MDAMGCVVAMLYQLWLWHEEQVQEPQNQLNMQKVALAAQQAAAMSHRGPDGVEAGPVVVRVGRTDVEVGRKLAGGRVRVVGGGGGVGSWRRWAPPPS